MPWLSLRAASTVKYAPAVRGREAYVLGTLPCYIHCCAWVHLDTPSPAYIPYLHTSSVLLYGDATRVARTSHRTALAPKLRQRIPSTTT